MNSVTPCRSERRLPGTSPRFPVKASTVVRVLPRCALSPEHLKTPVKLGNQRHGGFLTNFFPNIRVNSQPSPSELAKYSTISDGIGPHEHDGSGLHEHREPSFSQAQIKVLEAKGWHVDADHGQVYGSDGGEMPPLLVAAALHAARREGLLLAASESEDDAVAKMVSGPGEAAPVLRHLDLRQQP